MATKYRTEPAGSAFVVIDDAGEQMGTYPTENLAKQDIERCLKEDAMYETAKQLVDFAIKTHMQMFRVDRAVSRYWIGSAMEVV
jgi:hypothetical protein